ncbi:MAG: ATP-binding cassette domain-containing protein [Gemmatimonadaceae bacterium]|nr:ATP-binding cassette domain-containing protein [Gemmatimonadaceae bacterium]
MPTTPILEMHAVTRRWRPSPLGGSDERLALAPLSLELKSGELMAVVGAAGSGKSTLALLAAGKVAPSSGIARWCGGPDPAAARPQLIGPRPWEYSFLTVRQALAFHADVLALHDDALAAPTRFVPLMREVGLRGLSRVRLGALGPLDQLRITIAQALLAKPRLICIEEPFVFCGPAERREGVALLHRLVGSGLAILVTGRTVETCGGQGTADRVVMLRDGMMLNAEPARPSQIVLDLKVPSAEEALRRLSARLPSVRKRGRRLRVTLEELSPEAVLAVCRSEGVEVRASRVAEEPLPPRSEDAGEGPTPLPPLPPSP